MCGRVVINWSKELFEQTFSTQAPLFQSFNLAPTQYAPIIYRSQGKRETMNTRWGLIPSWVKDPKDFKANMFNARAEGLTEKASFKHPFRTQRCIVPISGFYEWKKTEAGKVPHYIYSETEKPLALAGLYEKWQKNSEVINSHTIITTTPNAFMKPLHNRMPVILDKKQFDLWLNPENTNTDLLEHLLAPYQGKLKAHPVNKRVGNVRHNDEDLLEPSD